MESKQQMKGLKVLVKLYKSKIYWQKILFSIVFAASISSFITFADGLFNASDKIISISRFSVYIAAAFFIYNKVAGDIFGYVQGVEKKPKKMPKPDVLCKE